MQRCWPALVGWCLTCVCAFGGFLLWLLPAYVFLSIASLCNPIVAHCKPSPLTLVNGTATTDFASSLGRIYCPLLDRLDHPLVQELSAALVSRDHFGNLVSENVAIHRSAPPRLKDPNQHHTVTPTHTWFRECCYLSCPSCCQLRNSRARAPENERGTQRKKLDRTHGRSSIPGSGKKVTGTLERDRSNTTCSALTCVQRLHNVQHLHNPATPQLATPHATDST